MATINPRQILLDALKSDKINANYNLKEESISPKSYGCARLVKVSPIGGIAFKNTNCIAIQHHKAVFNNGAGALFPALTSQSDYIDSVTGGYMGGVIYQSNMPGYNPDWVVATNAPVAPPTALADTGPNGLSAAATSSSYTVCSGILSSRPLINFVTEPWTPGAPTSNTVTIRLDTIAGNFNSDRNASRNITGFSLPNIVYTEPHLLLKYTTQVPQISRARGGQFPYQTASYFINIRTRMLTAVNLIAFVYDGTGVPKLDYLNGTRTES